MGAQIHQKSMQNVIKKRYENILVFEWILEPKWSPKGSKKGPKRHPKGPFILTAPIYQQQKVRNPKTKVRNPGGKYGIRNEKYGITENKMPVTKKNVWNRRKAFGIRGKAFGSQNKTKTDKTMCGIREEKVRYLRKQNPEIQHNVGTRHPKVRILAKKCGF